MKKFIIGTNNNSTKTIDNNYNKGNIHSFKSRLKLCILIIKKMLKIENNMHLSNVEKELLEKYYDEIKSSSNINEDFLYALQNILDSVDCQCKSLNIFLSKENKIKKLSECLPSKYI
jgi:quinolinate synthase